MALLEDPDVEVNQVVSDRIIDQGIQVVQLLEEAWESLPGEQVQRKIEGLIQAIQFKDIKGKLSVWAESSDDLLQGAFYVASYQYPNINYCDVDRRVNALRKEVWMELNGSLTAFEKVKIMNHILFHVHKYTGSTANFYSPQNHFINQVLESQRGGPVSLAILYSVIARRLELPIHGVSLPRNFLLAYMDSMEPPGPGSTILFYINPFNKGTVLGQKEIELFLKQNKIQPRDDYFTPCSNRTTVSQLIASLMISYQKLNQSQKVSELQELLNITSERSA